MRKLIERLYFDCFILIYKYPNHIILVIPQKFSPTIKSIMSKSNERSSQLQLTLSDVVNNTNDYEEFQIQISNDGRLVFVANLQYFTPVIAASLYRNDDGRLTLLGTLPWDPNFPTVSSGASSDDFSRFIILDQVAGTGIGIGRLRVFTFDFTTNTFVLVGSPLIFDDVNLLQDSLNVSKFAFTADNRYVAVSYINTISSTPSFGAVLKIVDLTMSPFTVTSTVDFQGFSDGAYFFQLKDKRTKRPQTYVVLPSTGYNAQGVSIEPAQIAFYRLDNGILTPVESPISLPQFVYAAVPFTYKIHSKILIAVSTGLAVLPGQPTVYDLSQTYPPNNDTTLNGKTDNLQIYEFDGSKARLVYKKSLDNFVGDLAWYPDGKHLAINLSAGFTNLLNIACSGSYAYATTSPAIFQVFDVTSKGKHHLDLTPSGFPLVAPTSIALMSFSKNGKWFIIGGGGPTYPSNVITTNLYRVIEDESSCKLRYQVIYPQRCH